MQNHILKCSALMNYLTYMYFLRKNLEWGPFTDLDLFNNDLYPCSVLSQIGIV